MGKLSQSNSLITHSPFYLVSILLPSLSYSKTLVAYSFVVVELIS